MQRLLKGLSAAALLSLTAGLAFAQVHISEVNPAGQWVELHNVGDAAVDVSGYVLCNFPEYAPITAAEIVSGELVIPADGFLVVRWDKFGTDDGEVGIYSRGGEFGNSEAIVDYLQYGSAGHRRETVGEGAGVWVAGAFLEVPADGMSLVRSDMMGDDPTAAWSAADATPGAGQE
jgi:hypothetical protein